VKWQQIYAASFRVGSKDVLQRGKHNLDFYVPKLAEMLCLNVEGTLESAIEEVFQTWVKDYPEFFKILRNKGFTGKEYLDSKKIELYLNENASENKLIKFSWLGYAQINAFTVNDQKYLKVAAYVEGKRVISFLVGEDEFYIGEKSGKIAKILSEIKYCKYDQKEIQDFYPKYRLIEFINAGGTNLLIPLIGEYFDSSIEKLMKSECYTFADSFYLHKKYINAEESEFKEIFKVPAKVLRKLTISAAKQKGVLKILKKTRETAPEYLQTDIISESLIQFLKYNVLVPYGGRRTTDIPGFKNMTKQTKLRISRTVSKLSTAADYGLYVDYLNMCNAMQEPIQIEIKGDISTIHDTKLKTYMEFMDRNRDFLFQGKIGDSDYKELEMIDETYIVVMPKSVDDIYREGRAMSNCVSTYIPRILDGSCYILFLRETKSPDVSFGTLEVRGNLLYQAKARFNCKLSYEAQKFLSEKYCREKNLSISTCDIERKYRD